MKTVVIDGVEYEILLKGFTSTGALCLHLKPLPKPKVTILDATAAKRLERLEYVKGMIGERSYDAFSITEERIAAIEQRLEALEK